MSLQKHSKHRPSKVVFPDDIFSLLTKLRAELEKIIDSRKIIKLIDDFVNEAIVQHKKINLARNGVDDVVRRVDPKALKAFRKLTTTEYELFLKIADRLQDSYRSTDPKRRIGAISALKGKIAEITFFKSDKFEGAFKRLKGSDDEVKLVKDIRGVAGTSGELTDNMVIDFPQAEGLNPVALAVFESKSSSNALDLIRKRGGKPKLEEEIEVGKAFIQEGQIVKDFERLTSTDLLIDGKSYPAGALEISRGMTEWHIIVPKGKKFDKHVKTLKDMGFNVKLHEHILDDKVFARIATELLDMAGVVTPR